MASESGRIGSVQVLFCFFLFFSCQNERVWERMG